MRDRVEHLVKASIPNGRGMLLEDVLGAATSRIIDEANRLRGGLGTEVRLESFALEPGAYRQAGWDGPPLPISYDLQASLTEVKS